MRKIIHIDADCFYAAVEARDNPKLKGRPIAVGGDPSGRGVVATCSYEARRFGVRSAMPSAHAKRLCPELEFLRPRMAKYKEASQQIMSILNDYSEDIEPLSLDEAYLDISQATQLHGSGTLIAKEIKKRVANTVGVTVSAGVAPVKFLAKVASDWQKPDGLFVILPEQVERFTARLPVAKIPGVGPVTQRKLKRMGVSVCADLREMGKPELLKRFGSFGDDLYERACGRDDRSVRRSRQRKSLSVERTFGEDILCEQLPAVVKELLAELSRRIKGRIDPHSVGKLFVKVKFDDFRQTTMETILPSLHRQIGWESNDFVSGAYQRLAFAAWKREERPVRLVGLGVGLLQSDRVALQLELDETW